MKLEHHVLPYQSKISIGITKISSFSNQKVAQSDNGKKNLLVF